NFICFAAQCSLQGPVCCAQDEQEQKELGQAREFYRAGQKYMLQGDFASANEEFMKAEIVLRSSPEVPLPEAPSGGSEASSGGSEAPALPQEMAAAPSNALDPDIYYNLGVGALQKGDFTQAEAAFLRVAELSPLDKEACYNLGVLYEKYLDKPQEAIRFYTRYVDLSDTGDRDVDRVKGWIADLKERMKR
ncbi:MAG: tetratricopeptide repeat protein, partial [Candidatus Omnitrophica bacterium]|nr:tetratricopeptide repeat protein [Candidatus Omnitrophota bacterium]